MASYITCCVAHSKGYALLYIDSQSSYKTCHITCYITHRRYITLFKLLYNMFFIRIERVIFNGLY